MIPIYMTDFRIVKYIPKPAFSCLMVLAGIDMCRTWIVGSFYKVKDKFEWMVAPILVVIAFSVGMLTAIFVGVAISTFIFTANFYRAGTVKFVGTGLTLRSPVERGPRESKFLDENADLIQILVLQNYLFFGNAQSVFHYVVTMFEDDDEDEVESAMQGHYVLPPRPKYVVVDFTLMTGMDTSALDVFQEIIDMCKTNRCKLIISGLSPNIKEMFRYAGITPEARFTSFVFETDVESALATAEDGLLKNTMHLLESDVNETNIRRHRRSVSDGDDGFVYALKKIDEQHGLDNIATDLCDIESYTRPVEIPAGGLLVRDQSDHGLYFVETGLMRVTPNASYTNTASLSGIKKESNDDSGFVDPTESIGHLNARAGDFGKRATQWKQNHENLEVHSHTFRLARIGQGWIIGSIDRVSDGMLSYGTHVAITDCRLHHLSEDARKEIEQNNPTLAMNLYKLSSLLSTKRQESTINQLGQFLKIMKNPLPRLRGGKKQLAQLTFDGM